MADINFNCPECGHNLLVDESGAGITVPCPECAKPIKIPCPPAQAAYSDPMSQLRNNHNNKLPTVRHIRIISTLGALILLAIIFALILTQKREVRGSAFMLTSNAYIDKLGHMKLKVYRERKVLSLAEPIVNENIKEYERLIAGIKEAEGEDYYELRKAWAALTISNMGYDSTAKTLETLWSNKPIVEAQTDASGKFSITVPKYGNYVLIASRTGHPNLFANFLPMCDDIWVINLERILANKEIILSNDNRLDGSKLLSYDFRIIFPQY